MKTDAILSKREREVMNLVVLGYSAREIADRMNVIYQSSPEHLRQDGDQTDLAGACYMVFHGKLRHLPERVRNDPENRGGDTSLSVLGRSVQYRFRVPQVKKPTPWPDVQGRRVNRELNQNKSHEGYCYASTRG